MLRFFTSLPTQRPNTVRSVTPATYQAAVAPSTQQRSMVTEQEYNELLAALNVTLRQSTKTAIEVTKPAQAPKAKTKAKTASASPHATLSRHDSSEIALPKTPDFDISILAARRAQYFKKTQELQQASLITDIHQIYQLLDTAISQRITQNNNKNLLIIIAEQHYNKKPLIVELVAVHLAKKYNITHFAIEQSKRSFRMIEEMIPGDHEPNGINLLPAIYNKKLSICPVDAVYNPYDESHQVDEMREATMIANLIKLNKNTLFVVGAAHLAPIANAQTLKEAFNILSINATNLDDRELLQLKAESTWALARANYFSHSTEVLQANVATYANVIPISEIFDTVNSTLKKIQKDEIEQALTNVASLRPKI